MKNNTENNIFVDKDKKIEIDNKKREEFKDKIIHYNTWRWSGVSLYQSIFVVFLTSAILVLIDLTIKEDLTSKIFLIICLVIGSFLLYTKMIKQASKPIFVAENMVATLESEPQLFKAEDGKEYYIMKFSSPIFNKIPKEDQSSSKSS